MIGSVRLMAVLVAVSFMGAGTVAVTAWHRSVIRTAVEAERIRIEAESRDVTDRAIAEARDAADSVGETPEDIDSLKEICRREASCLERGTLQ